MKDPDIRLRLDANNLWAEADNIISYIQSLEYKFYAIEEPLLANKYDDLREIYNELDIRVILDESFYKSEQFMFIDNDPNKWIINLRVSKMGGLLRSMEIAKTARDKNIDIIVGAHVGETSILTRAALTVANEFGDILITQEGAFGTYLLQNDICDPALMFAEGGKIHASQVNKNNRYGLGLNIDRGLLPSANI